MIPSPPTLRAGDRGAAVLTLQQRLASAGAAISVDGWYGDATEHAVRAFQRARDLVADGVAGPRTQATLLGVLDDQALRQTDVQRAAAELGCDVATLQAVIEVESPQGGFLADGRVVILFERHIFWRQLEGAGVDPASLGAPASILSPQRGGYLGGAAEYPRLSLASGYGPEQAMASCSWGRFQIMGLHAQALGYGSATAMAQAFAQGEAEQLAAFVRFVQADPDLAKVLRGHKWAAFARRYNGPAYAEHLYDARLARAYARHSAAVPAEAS